MKKRYSIKDFIQKNETNEPLYYNNQGTWTSTIYNMKEYDNENEALMQLNKIINEQGGYYEIITIYSK